MNSPHIFPAEELLSVLFHSPNATAVYKGESLIICSVNAKMLNFWGKDRSIVSKPLSQALPELINQPFLGMLQSVWRSGKSLVAENQPATIHVDGRLQEFFFDFEYKAILNELGNTTYILHTAVEVSERISALKSIEEKTRKEKQLSEELIAINEGYKTANEESLKFQQNLKEANHSLNESENRFRILVEKAPVAMALLQGEDFIIELVNDMALSIWGKDRKIIGSPLHLALPEIKDQPFLDILKEVYNSGNPFIGTELKATLKYDEGLRDCYLNFVYKAVLNVTGDPTGIMIVATDVSEQVNSRKAIEDVNTRLQIALDAGKLGSTEVEIATGEMQSTNQFKANYGFSEDEDFNYADLFAAILPEYRENVKMMVQHAMDTNDVYKTEYPVRWRDGSIHWIQAHGRPRYDEHGKADRIVGMTMDISDRKLFEQKKDDFLSIASHELKTPITSLRASLQLLDRIKDRSFSPMHTRLIKQCNKSVFKMEQLVGDLLNMNRLNQDQLSLSKTTFCLYDMLAMCCNHVRMEGRHQIVISGDKTLQIYADEHRIDQVVVNFVNNAVKYAPGSDDININIERFEQEVRLSVVDTGPGIQREFLPKIFDRYYRADHSSKSYTGLGLGLYICAEIIKRHGGQIGASSVPGQGSTFWFTLPLPD